MNVHVWVQGAKQDSQDLVLYCDFYEDDWLSEFLIFKLETIVWLAQIESFPMHDCVPMLFFVTRNVA